MKSSQTSSPLTRRDAIKKTIVFSTGLLTAGWLSQLQGQAPLTKFSSKGLHLLALGDFGTGDKTQRAIAQQMAKFSKKLDAPLEAVLALGDNFYGKLVPERFRTHFEEMYPEKEFACPFYACLGNHDYGPKYDADQGRPKAQMQLDYAKDNPDSRWKMPARWYVLELPDAKNPLVKIIVLDGNMAEAALTPQEKLAQKRFLEAELKKETRAPWRWVVSHFPMFSETVKRGDSDRFIKLWGEHLKSHPISLYLSGHDHNLQHLEVDGYNSSFVVSGAGGAGLYDVTPSTRGFSEMILGFTHLHVTPDAFDVQFIDVEGNRLHGFRRTLKGKVEITSKA
jgi:tartrate-resistant acid phosphatase type 5